MLKVGFWLLAKLVETEAAASRPAYVRDLLENALFVDAVFALSIEVPAREQVQALVEDDESLTFDSILRSFQVDCYDVWRVITSVLATPRLDLHLNLKNHLVYVEMRAFLEVFWREKSPLVDLLVRSAQEAKEQASLQGQAAPPASAESMASIAASHKVGPGEQVFVKKLLELMVERIFCVSRFLGFNGKQMELVWELAKHVLNEHVELLLGRHLDHVLICAVYAASKHTEKEHCKKFDRIFQA